jgi:hypothetical protein
MAIRGQFMGLVLLRAVDLLWICGMLVGGLFGLTLPLVWMGRRKRISAVLGEEVGWH